MKQLTFADEIAREALRVHEQAGKITRPIDNQMEALRRASARRDLGIQRSADHAGDRWQTLARGYLLEYLATHEGPFLAEDVREFADGRGLESAPDGRAWGQVMRSAAREGLIVKAGYAPAKSSNLSPKVQWRAA